MKLLLCIECNSVFNLVVGQEKTCLCGNVKGKYLDDGLYAEYTGDSAVPLGMANNSLVSAIKSWQKGAKNYNPDLNIRAWCISKESDRVKWIQE